MNGHRDEPEATGTKCGAGDLGCMKREPPLYAALAGLLIAYTDDFDAAMKLLLKDSDGEPPPSLAMCANVLRFVGDSGLEASLLPKLSGIARPTIKSMLDCLHRHGWINVDSARFVTCTPRGAEALRAMASVQRQLDRKWKATLGNEIAAALQSALNSAGSSLPAYPMTAAHRGAFPRGQ
jgi:hypothetical protein